MLMKMLAGRDRRTDDGAIAVMVAIMSLMLFTLGALAVDLGNAYVHKHDIQKTADFAALAGAAGDNLPATLTGTGCSLGTNAKATDQSVIDAASYLSEHYPTAVTATQLVNCDVTDGEAGYGQWQRSGATWTLTPNKDQFSVISQHDTVNYGLGKLLGQNSVDVNGAATVEIKSPLMKTLPFYAKDACSWGSQTISQPPNGHAEGLKLFAPTDTNTALLTSLTTNPATSNPWTVPLDATAPSDSLVITAQVGTLAGVTKVGFFQSGALSTGPNPEDAPVPTVDVDGVNAVKDGTNTTITIPHLPSTVVSTEGAWYTRVKIGASWSAIETKITGVTTFRALMLIVGQPTLTCGQGSDQGNFGTLDLPPNSPPAAGLSGVNDQISYNISQGLTGYLAPFDPTKYTENRTCTATSDGATVWDGPGTNCVLTQPGVPSGAAEQGFVLGIPHTTYTKGLLQDVNPAHFCPNDYPTATHVSTLRGVSINNDVVTCFLLDNTTTVSDVSSKTYAGPVVFDQSIYNSPRFVTVPVLQFPGKGGSDRYQILDFRPGFISDQLMTDTRDGGSPIVDPTCGSNAPNWSGTCNGVKYDKGQLLAVNVIFINQAALPDPPLDPNGKYIPYRGAGPKVPLLVD
jgi:Flp pilus assembly protein TadG